MAPASIIITQIKLFDQIIFLAIANLKKNRCQVDINKIHKEIIKKTFYYTKILNDRINTVVIHDKNK